MNRTPLPRPLDLCVSRGRDCAMMTFRLFLCARCRKQSQICPSCDCGQLYCSKDCSSAARQEARRDSSRRYQRTPRGLENHRRRQREYRARLANVTHHGAKQESQAPVCWKTPPHRAIQGCNAESYRATSCVCCGRPVNGWTRWQSLRDLAHRRRNHRPPPWRRAA